jgi:hypothetical protein
VTIICDTADEPEYGAAPYPFWAELHRRPCAAWTSTGPMWPTCWPPRFPRPPGLPGWRIATASEGVPATDAALLGFGPADPTAYRRAAGAGDPSQMTMPPWFLTPGTLGPVVPPRTEPYRNDR